MSKLTAQKKGFGITVPADTVYVHPDLVRNHTCEHTFYVHPI